MKALLEAARHFLPQRGAEKPKTEDSWRDLDIGEKFQFTKEQVREAWIRVRCKEGYYFEREPLVVRSGHEDLKVRRVR